MIQGDTVWAVNEGVRAELGRFHKMGACEYVSRDEAKND